MAKQKETQQKQKTEADASLDQLQQELEAAKKAQEEMLAQTQRALADYANLKKRFEREREELGKFAGEAIVLQFLPAIDNLERAVSFASEADQQTSVFQGVKMTLTQLEETLKRLGFERIQTAPGEPFNPHHHEAIEMVNGHQGQIMEVLEAGYKLHDKVIRPTRVKVGNGE